MPQSHLLAALTLQIYFSSCRFPISIEDAMTWLLAQLQAAWDLWPPELAHPSHHWDLPPLGPATARIHHHLPVLETELGSTLLLDKVQL